MKEKVSSIKTEATYKETWLLTCSENVFFTFKILLLTVNTASKQPQQKNQEPEVLRCELPAKHDGASGLISLINMHTLANFTGQSSRCKTESAALISYHARAPWFADNGGGRHCSEMHFMNEETFECIFSPRIFLKR